MADCPAHDCSGGAGRGREVQDPARVELPNSITPPKPTAKLFHCSYCGFLWYEYMFSDAPRPFLVKYPVGFFDNFTKPREFFPVSPDYRLKSEPKARRRH